MNAVVDNDVLLKLACYRLLPQLVTVVDPSGDGLGFLGAAKFILPKKVERKKLKGGSTEPLKLLSAFFQVAQILEPSEEEQRLAAEIESVAQKAGLNLDAGESQLCAIVIKRLIPLFVTGDKRAIISIEQTLDATPSLKIICGKVKCLEQLVLSLFAERRTPCLCAAICSEPEVDKALTLCFSCSSPEVSHDSHKEALESYIRALREAAERVLSAV